jgi:YHS domain-containing protein
MKKDPVCYMEVDENTAIITKCDGVIYYFCSEGCKEKFLKDKTYTVKRTSYDLIIIGGGLAGNDRIVTNDAQYDEYVQDHELRYCYRTRDAEYAG